MAKDLIDKIPVEVAMAHGKRAPQLRGKTKVVRRNSHPPALSARAQRCLQVPVTSYRPLLRPRDESFQRPETWEPSLRRA
jgi:hypothetical protein